MTTCYAYRNDPDVTYTLVGGSLVNPQQDVQRADSCVTGAKVSSGWRQAYEPKIHAHIFQLMKCSMLGLK